MFQLCGIPYLEAPSEAEAECAQLFKDGLVDFIFTDDSDIFLFGGDKVFKNVFSSKRDMVYYEMNNVATRTGILHMFLSLL